MRLSASRRCRRSARRGFSCQLSLEALEARTLLSVSLVRDIYPGFNDSAPVDLTAVNNSLFFVADDGTHGFSLWKTDGTGPDTVLVKPLEGQDLANVDGTLFFTTQDGGNRSGLWMSDGTANGTTLVEEFNSSLDELTNVAGTLFFTEGNDQLWESDGTNSGTVMLADENLAQGYVFAEQLTGVGNTLFFVGSNSADNEQLWKSDGTAGGTVPVTDINSTQGLGFEPFNLTNVSGTLFFAGDDGTHGNELWKSDGTTTGTVLVKDINPGPASSMVQSSNFANVDGTLFFAASDGSHYGELWRSDGTAAGTVLVAVYNPGVYPDSSPGTYTAQSLTNVGGTLFFAADDGTHGYQLWKSDGTAEGTGMVLDIPNPSPLGALSFSRDYEPTGSLDANNGTHTPPVGEPLGVIVYSQLTNVDGTVYFRADDGVHGAELWHSDGTAAGTHMVADINPGPAPSDPDYLTNLNGTLFFSALDHVVGRELWEATPQTSPLPSNDQIAVAGSGSSQAIFVVAPDQTLWRSSASGAWTYLGAHIQSVSAVMTSSSNAVAFAVTTDHGLIEFNPYGSRLIGAPGTVQSVSAGTDFTGQADAWVLTGDSSLTEYRDAGGWLVSPVGGAGSILQFSAGEDGHVVAVTADHSVFEYASNFGWFRVAGGGFAESVSVVSDASGTEVIYVQTPSLGLFRHDAGGWQQIGAVGTIASMSAAADGAGGDEIVVVSMGPAISTYDSTSGWSQNDVPPVVESLAANPGGGLVVFLADQSVSQIDGQGQLSVLSDPGLL